MRPVSWRAAILFVGLAAVVGAASAQAQTWQPEGSLRVIVDTDLEAGRLITVQSGDRTLAVVASLDFNLYAPVEAAVEAVEPDRLVLRLTYPDLADWEEESGPQTAHIEITPVEGGLRVQAEPTWASHVRIRLLDLGAPVYGVVERLGADHQKSPDLRGQTVDVEVVGEDRLYAENHANLWSPFFISARGYGSFVDTFARGRYMIGVDGQHNLSHETGALDWYLFDGPGGARIHEAYFRVVGRPKSVPMWALGPILWRNQNEGGAAEVLADLDAFTQREVPVTAWWLDRPYSSGTRGWSEMDVSDAFNGPFADAGEWIAQLGRQGVRLMTWIAPLTFDPDGDFPATFQTPHAYFDLTDPDAAAEFARRLRERQHAFGVRGHKLDRGDESFPHLAEWADGTPEPERRNRYVLLYETAVHDALAETWGADQFTFARTGWSRSQPVLSAVWGGDVRTSWDGLASNVANAVRAGYLGFPVWGTDGGGYLGLDRPTAELYTRWIEWAAWNGMFEVKLDGPNDRGETRLPWDYPEPVLATFREAAVRRMRLLPTLYSLANTSARHGVMMQPMQYAFPDDRNTWDLWDQHLLGDIFLVAPVLEPGAVSRSVYFPAGRWHRFDDPAETYDGGQTAVVDAPLGGMPVFVRSNRVYLTGDVLAANQPRWRPGVEAARSLTVHVFPGLAGENYTFDYVDADDGDAVKSVRVERALGAVRVAAPPLGLGGLVEIRLDGPPALVTSGGRPVDAPYDAEKRVVRIAFQASAPLDIAVRLR